MIVSAKTEYACIAMLELAAREEQAEPVRIKDIADRHNIPSRFLVQILLQLKSAGLVQSIRGAAGGYQLAKAPEEITLGTVMSAVDGQSHRVSSSLSSDSPTTRVLHNRWQMVADKQRELLGEVTLADLVAELRGQASGMYYI